MNFLVRFRSSYPKHISKTSGEDVIFSDMYLNFIAKKMRKSFDFLIVPRKGFEPPHLAALAPETSASTSFATWALPVEHPATAGLRTSFRESAFNKQAAKVNFQR